MFFAAEVEIGHQVNHARDPGAECVPESVQGQADRSVGGKVRLEHWEGKTLGTAVEADDEVVVTECLSQRTTEVTCGTGDKDDRFRHGFHLRMVALCRSAACKPRQRNQ